MNGSKATKLLQIGFLAGIALFLLCSLGKAMLFPKDINTYENRKANQTPPLTLSDFLSSQFQDGLEAALSDQVPGAEALKHRYNTLESTLSFYALGGLYDAYPNRYFRYNKALVFRSDYLLYEPRPLTEDSQAAFDRKLASITSVASSHPELDFHVFYIEKDTDMNFETGADCGNYSYIAEHSDPDLYSLSYYPITDFSEFSQSFYQTDHHWNHAGSYKAYLQLCEELGLSDPIEKGEEFRVASHLEGSKLSLANHSSAFSEPMYAYGFSFPTMEISVNGEIVSDYGRQNQSFGATATYGQYYGSDMGEILFSTGDAEKENLLVIGESYDNAVLKLRATHFNKTCSIDLRYYEHYMGQPFDFDTYVRTHEIHRVLFIGNIDFFVMDEFNVGG